MDAPLYGPPDASIAPRYTGVRTFARCPHVEDWAGADVAVIGIPFDTATSFRPGARFGPAAIREQSQLVRPGHAGLEVDVFAGLSVIDGGDLAVTPGNAERTAGQIAGGLAPVVDGGAIPIVLGGDHSIVLAEPVAKELGDADVSFAVGLVVAGGLYLLLGRNVDARAEAVAISESEQALEGGGEPSAPARS